MHQLHHISLIVSSEKAIEFYTQLGFVEIKRNNRGYDIVVYMSGYGITLEIYIDATHPPRVNRPEALGLRHFALLVNNIEDIIDVLGIKNIENIREDVFGRYTFVTDPDGLPIELREE